MGILISELHADRARILLIFCRNARNYLSPCWPSRRPNRQLVLGTLLLGARNQPRRQPEREEPGQQSLHVLFRNGSRKACSPFYLHGPGDVGYRPGPNGQVPPTLPPGAADHWQGGRGKQLRPWTLHHRQRAHRPSARPGSKTVGWL